MTADERKRHPIYSGVLRYFPKALLAIAHCSWVGNEQHNPGEKLRWAKEKSTDEPDALVRHLLEAGTCDTDGVRHSTKVAWRALALLERELEAAESACQEGTMSHQQTFGCPPNAEKAPSPEGKRAYGEALGGWVPGATRFPTRERDLAKLNAEVEGLFGPPLPAPSPAAQTSGPDSARPDRPEYAHPLPSSLRAYLEAASPASLPAPPDAARPAASTPSRPNLRHSSEPGPDGWSEGLDDA